LNKRLLRSIHLLSDPLKTLRIAICASSSSDPFSIRAEKKPLKKRCFNFDERSKAGSAHARRCVGIDVSGIDEDVLPGRRA
jgi:hypothetical protein